MRLLGFVVRQLRAAAALVVGTYRDVDVAVEDHPGQSELVELTGLTLEEVGELLHAICGERPPAPLVGAVHQRTAGNPFFVRQVARLLSAQGTPLARSTVTGRIPRLHKSDPEATGTEAAERWEDSRRCRSPPRV